MAEPMLTLQDIAELAKVERPVVSMWRKRPTVRGQYLPFPEPAETGRVPRFRRDDIVDWLEQTGRGNNREYDLDAPTLGVPEGVSLDELVILLCLRAAGSQQLTEEDTQGRIDAAEDVDPHDQYLLCETRELNPSHQTLAFVDDLVASCFGLDDALEHLEHGRAAREIGARDLINSAVDLLRTIAHAAVSFIDAEAVPLVCDGESATFALTLAEDFPEIVIEGEGEPTRALRRRALIRGFTVIEAAVGPQVRLLSVVGANPDDALDAIDNTLLDLGLGQVALIIGAASTLCDSLRGDREHQRSQTLRSGNLAVALRLPRGLWKEAHRQALGVWVCTGDRGISQPLVADLGVGRIEDLDREDLSSDIVAALAQTRSRSYRYLRAHQLPEILVGGPPVPPGMTAYRLHVGDPIAHIDRVYSATRVTSVPIRTLDTVVTAHQAMPVLRRRTLAELKRDGVLRMVRGNRIDTEKAAADGTVALLSADRSTDHLRFDPLDVSKHYGRAVHTEPGDVIFADRPRPVAFVDERGGALVASPSRVLRLAPNAGIGPRALAVIINQLPETARDWQSWSVPVIDKDEVLRLEAVLTDAAHYREHLRERLRAADDLEHALIDGIGAGALSLHTTDGSKP
ncbi:helix-turn-helix transcriptional regulator [Nocardia sp. NPDC058058]|uniref:helix-turn-helix transcriptional regulator n=1 Tax=Nocardia sp. NPDC058058 TaxID=3346317 RepID=UPI0036DAA664